MYKIEKDYGLIGINFTLKDGSTLFVKNERKMEEIEKEALVLFKDYTMLQLKAFKASFEGGFSGATENYYENVLDKAIEYHRYYTSLKLKESKK